MLVIHESGEILQHSGKRAPLLGSGVYLRPTLQCHDPTAQELTMNLSRSQLYDLVPGISVT